MKSDFSLAKIRMEANNNANIPEIQSKGYLSKFIRNNSSPFSVPMATSVEWVQQHPTAAAESPVKEMSQEYYFRLRFETIEKLLTEQNANLRKQAEFLTFQARNALHRQKRHQDNFRKLQKQYQNTLKQLKYVTEENFQIREYIQRKIISLLSAIKQSSIEAIVGDVKQVVKELCQFFSINLQVKLNRRDSQLQAEYISSQDPRENRARVDQLSDKFEALLYEYKSSSRPELRKQCILIAKEIKQLKQQLPANSNQNQSRSDQPKKRFSKKQSKQNLKASISSKNPASGDLPQFASELQQRRSQQKLIYRNDDQYLIQHNPKRRTMTESKSTSYLAHIRADRDVQ